MIIKAQLDQKERLDVFIKRYLPLKSRSSIQKLINRGYVFINNKLISKNGHFVEDKDVIKLTQINIERKIREYKPVKMNFEVLYQDKDTLVINKPVGISVHKGSGKEQKTVLDGLLYKFRKLKEIGEEKRFGLVHRLDKDTSGVLLVALSDHALWYYSRQFENREVEKIYLAVVFGDIEKKFKSDNFEISGLITRNIRDRKKMMMSKDKGKHSVSEFFVIKKLKHKKLGTITLLKVILKTGRTHQIRVHLSSNGFPVIGDTIYGGKDFSRLLLHAYSVKFKLINGEETRIYSDIPEEITNLFGHFKKYV